jgi:ABC-type nickel/cobalt efflux system permease component RcnA
MDALYLGSVVTITHTASVFILGIVTLYASQTVALERIYPVLSLVSGLLVAGIGGWLLWKRARGHDHHHHHHGTTTRTGTITTITIMSIPTIMSMTTTMGTPAITMPTKKGPDAEPARSGFPAAGAVSGSVVVLMLSISIQRVALGLALLASFTLGLAAVLIAIGCAMVLAGPAMTRLSGESGWTKKLPVASAVVVTVLGVLMVVEAARNF